MSLIEELCERLISEGWLINEASVLNSLEDDGKEISSYADLKNRLLNMDIKDFVNTKVSTDEKNKTTGSISFPVVVQVCKIRDVSRPKKTEGGDHSAVGRLLKLTLTDGVTVYHALENVPCSKLSINTAPGTKLLLTSKPAQSGGYLLLSPKNFTVLGGKVDVLYQKWSLTESVWQNDNSNTNSDGSKPPSWVPFNKSKGRTNLRNGVKAPRVGSQHPSDKGDESEEDSFALQRNQTVKELVKEQRPGAKVFGGGRSMLDSNLARVIAAGFEADVAEWALKNNRNDVGQAIRELRIAAGGGTAPPRFSSSPPPDDRPRTSRGGARGGKRKGRKGEDDYDSEEDYEAMKHAPRPSGPANLFDFFDAKLNQRNEKVEFRTEVPDVRGFRYEENKREREAGGGRARGRGRGGRGGRFDRGGRFSAHSNSPVPDMSSTHLWPAPGEENKPKTKASTESYLEAQARIEELEEQQREEERMAREDQMRMSKTRSGEVLHRPSSNRLGSGYDTQSNRRGTFGQSNAPGRGGYESGRGGYNESRRGGYSENRRGGYNENRRGGYSESNRGYDENKRGGYRGDKRGGHGSNSEAQYSNNSRDDYSTSYQSEYDGNSRRGYGNRRGGYNDNRGSSDGGHSVDDYGGYRRGDYRGNNRGDYRGNSRRGDYGSHGRGDYRGNSRGDYGGNSRGDYRGNSRDAYGGDSWRQFGENRGEYGSAHHNENDNNSRGGYNNQKPAFENQKRFDPTNKGCNNMHQRHDYKSDDHFGEAKSNSSFQDSKSIPSYHDNKHYQTNQSSNRYKNEGIYQEDRANDSSGYMSYENPEGDSAGGTHNTNFSAGYGKHNLGSRVSGAPPSLTRTQQDLIDQFKKSVSLQGYTGYEELEEMKPSTGVAVEYVRGRGGRSFRGRDRDY